MRFSATRFVVEEGRKEARRNEKPTKFRPWVVLCGLAMALLAPPMAIAREEDPKHPADQAEAPTKAAETQKRYSNRVRWSTASELDNFGFDVFRGDAEDGPFVRLNEETIVGAGTTDEPSYYHFVDDTIDPYKAYYYYVESISMSNVREHFTPVSRAKPKLPEDAAEETPVTEDSVEDSPVEDSSTQG